MEGDVKLLGDDDLLNGKEGGKERVEEDEGLSADELCKLVWIDRGVEDLKQLVGRGVDLGFLEDEEPVILLPVPRISACLAPERGQPLRFRWDLPKFMSNTHIEGLRRPTVEPDREDPSGFFDLDYGAHAPLLLGVPDVQPCARDDELPPVETCRLLLRLLEEW